MGKPRGRACPAVTLRDLAQVLMSLHARAHTHHTHTVCWQCVCTTLVDQRRPWPVSSFSAVIFTHDMLTPSPLLPNLSLQGSKQFVNTTPTDDTLVKRPLGADRGQRQPGLGVWETLHLQVVGTHSEWKASQFGPILRVTFTGSKL